MNKKDKKIKVNGADVVFLREVLGGLTQKDFAELLNVSVVTVQGWENGRKKPSNTSQVLLKMIVMFPNLMLDLLKRVK